MPDRNTLGDGWTDELRAICARKCGEFGDPPCWDLIRNTVDKPEVIDPCFECIKIADRAPFEDRIDDD